jgi:putative hydroxymethylpyrimidine transport system permease protein
MNLFYRGMIVIIFLILLWQGLVSLFQLPSYILPSPIMVFNTLYLRSDLLVVEAIPTIIETLSGLLLGILLGCFAGFCMAFFRPIAWGLLPLLVISQAIPTFAIAPLLVIWLGYGMASKIMTTIIMLFFPIANAFYNGLSQTELGWLDLAKSMNANQWKTFWHIRIPAALPYLATGIRIAAAIAPIGAIVGEWVGASHGLGFLMLNANARMQIDLMFAALIVLIILSLSLYFMTDRWLKKMIYW